MSPSPEVSISRQEGGMQVSSALVGGKDQEKALRICQNCLCIKEATVTKTGKS